MKFRIGYRTIKTAVGAMISILLAQYLGLENFASSGILTILCVKSTKKNVFACIMGSDNGLPHWNRVFYRSF